MDTVRLDQQRGCVSGFGRDGDILKQLITAIGMLVLTACNQGAASNKLAATDASGESNAPHATASSAARLITCHELIGGKPSPEATTYELLGRKFYSRVPGGERQLISAEGELVNLGRSEDDEGPQDSFASHTVQGVVLTRTVLWQRPGQASRTAFVERYDFRKQAVLDADTGEDTCHHNARPDGRTQEQAERDALSGTGRGDTWSSNAE